MYLDDAKEIWSDLKDRFSQCDSARIYQLKQKIMSLTQGDDDVNTYFTNLRIIWDEYKHTQPISWCICTNCRCQSAAKWHKHQEEECAMQFLIGLNASYSQICSHILSMVPLPTLSKAFSLVLQEERQRTIGGYSQSPKYSPLPPAVSEHPYSANTASTYYNRTRVCTHCGKTNHTADKCFTLHGFPPSYGKGKFKPNQNWKNYSNSKSVNFVDDTIPEASEKAVTSSTMPTFDQCQQLISLLQSQLATGSSSLTSSAAQNLPSPTQSPPFTGAKLKWWLTAALQGCCSCKGWMVLHGSFSPWQFCCKCWDAVFVSCGSAEVQRLYPLFSVGSEQPCCSFSSPFSARGSLAVGLQLQGGTD
ncbi:uncharacterized protein LOC121787335 [Salvia splendens]|uniref:uncharacterized protein LOC121787335 n=1 Tax=Salvia splendens TaxID=180675 RepID=UPI001C27E896|nr:uncharacterized protein LOC121787335 [Salvia splendens]